MASSSSEIRRPLKGPRREASCGHVSSISYVRVDIFIEGLQSNARHPTWTRLMERPDDFDTSPGCTERWYASSPFSTPPL